MSVERRDERAREFLVLESDVYGHAQQSAHGAHPNRRETVRPTQLAQSPAHHRAPGSFDTIGAKEANSRLVMQRCGTLLYEIMQQKASRT